MNDTDPRLQSALRHAPDHDTEPPPGINAAILRAARASLGAAPWWRRALDRLTSPAWASGTAGVMVAVLAGLLWWDQEPPAPVVARAPERPAAGAPGPAPTAAVQEAPAAPAAAPAAAGHKSQAAAARAAAAEQYQLQLAEAASSKRPPAAPPGERRAMAGKAADAAADTALPAGEPTGKLQAPGAAAPPAAQPAQAPASTRTLAQAPVPADGVPVPAPERQATAAAAAAPAPARNMASGIGPASAAPEPPADVRGGLALTAPVGWQRLRAAAADDPRWTWQRAGSGSPVMLADPAAQSWVRALRFAPLQWHAGVAAVDGAPQWRWFEAGRLRASVRLEGTRLWWQDAGGMVWHADLPPATAAALDPPLLP
ncbi:hypothetical protein [Ideonella sp. BN130291]|uniref:hypothetical protein n=1 Tax=Ideonella sp. BN130291 TaxID=3112940 RepID=UPI002E257D92|nr:hypothetical protein [Ideonella sp. BN130291]